MVAFSFVKHFLKTFDVGTSSLCEIENCTPYAADFVTAAKNVPNNDHAVIVR